VTAVDGGGFTGTRRVVVTADDFGVAVAVNEAVEEGHRRGILSAASLMVGADAAADAVRRARAMPTLGVGLHLVLIDGKPVLPPDQLPDLVGPDGRLPKDELAMGVKIFCSRRARAQAAAEARAQFEAFRRTGLPLDHVNGHHHFHVHPTVQRILLGLAAEFGVKAVRVPHEPFGAAFRAMGDKPGQRLLAWAFHTRRATWMKRRLRRAGIGYNEHIFGLVDSGHMTPERMRRYIEALPPGVSEVYCHPSTRRYDGPDALPPSYEPVGEYEALVDAGVAAALRTSGAASGPFAAVAR
jgi:hopanoid biosynthesis associated protein HpnK